MRQTDCIAAAVILAVVICGTLFAGPLIIDHHDTQITELTESEINRARASLHIAYGHTSHGSQVTDGMSGLVDFANGGGKGLSLPTDIFEWNNGGTGGALDLHDYAMGGDVGYYPDWYDNTTGYLESAANSNVNVIIWSWCGQMDDKYSGGALSNEFLLPMSCLETSYPDVVFVYMTGHAQIDDDADNKAACRMIRDYCTANNKVLYDFNDIEHYDPDGTYYEFVHDNCDYYTAPTPGGSKLGNWATNWQGSHTEDVDWYNCSSAHSKALNANQKAYAAWALWCSLAEDLDRDDIPDGWEERYGGVDRFSGGTNDCDGDGTTDSEEYVADTCPTSTASIFRIDGIFPTNSCGISFSCSTGRVYGLECTDDLLTGQWCAVPGQTNVQGASSGVLVLTDTNDAAFRAYRICVGVP